MQKINNNLINPLLEKAQNSPRKRINYNFHQLEEKVNRFLNVLQPQTFIAVHKHQNPDRFEVFLILTGKAAILEFDDDGKIIDVTILDAKQNSFGVEIAPCVWHTVICLEENTVCYEIKEGPYDANQAKYFAPFSPLEGDDGADEYREGLLNKMSQMGYL